MIPYRPVGDPGAPIVLLYHGLGASKDIQGKELHHLAEAGFLAIGVDAVGHGERRWANFDDLARKDFLDIVRQTVAEVPALLDHLSERFGADRFGIAGISMGGLITFGACRQDPRLTAAVSILGSPDWSLLHPAPDSPHLEPERFRDVALLACNARDDEHVPAGPTRDFLQRAPGVKAYHEYPGGHFMTDGDWTDLLHRTSAWFQAHLAG